MVLSAAFSPDGSRIVTASDDNAARVWRADSGALLAELGDGGKGHFRRVQPGRHPHRHRVRGQDSLCLEGRLVWRADSGTLLAELKGNASRDLSAAFSPDGTRIVTASYDKTARVWRFDTISGDASIFSLWVETLTGTELKGGAVEPLSLDAWNQRKTALQAQRDRAPPEDWFKASKPPTSKPPTTAK